MRNFTFLILALIAIFFAGCGKSDDSVIQEQMEIMKETLAVLEKVSDADSGKKADVELKKLQEKTEELDKVVRGWSKEKKEALAKKHDLDKLGEKLQEAYKKARQFLP